jgi:hypothetical protein
MVISRAEVLDPAAAWSKLTVTVATLPIMLCTSRFRQLSWIIAIIHELHQAASEFPMRHI